MILAACGSSGSSGGGGANTTSSGGPTTAGSTSTTEGEFGTLPPQSGTPVKGGTITYDIEAGSQPTYIFPIVPGAQGSVYNQEFDELMFRPLYWFGIGNRIVPNNPLSMAAFPVYSDGNKTLTINLKPSYKWSDGKQVTASDVIFFIDELRAAVKENPANFGDYTPGDFPDNVVSATAVSPEQLVLKLKRAYNPTWFNETQLNLIQPLPSTAWNVASTGGAHLDFTNPANAKKIYDYLNKASKTLGTYATNPLWQDVDGPFKLTSFNTTTDANTMVPNPTYGGPQKPQFSELKAVYFASSSAEFNALRSGALNEGGVSSASIPQVPQLKTAGYNVYGYPDLGFYFMVFNFKDKTDNWDKIIGQLYVRQALAHLQDETAIIHGGFHGAAGPSYGPVPAVPSTPFTPANASTNPYPFSTSAAAALLTAHGWKVVPNGTTTCTRPGTAANECGAGIPAGQKISITIPYTNDPPISGQEVVQLASAAKQIGINITPVSKTFNFLINQYDDPAAPANDNKWQMENFGGFGGIVYPTTDEVFNTTGSFNSGGYSSTELDKLIDNSKFSSNPSAIQQEATYISTNLPGLFGPNEDRTVAWKGVSGPPDSFANLTQELFTPEYWYLTK